MSETAAVGAGATAEAEAIETQDVNLHPSIADMLSDNPEGDALGGLTGKEEETGEEVTEPPSPEPEPEKKAEEVSQEEWQKRFDAMLAKAEDEKRKRQDLERSLNQRPAEPVKKADLFEDPDTRFNQEIDPIRQEFTNRFINMSESYARRAHGADKFNEAQDAFLAEARANPSLVQAALNSDDPGEYQYQEGRKILMAKELGEGGIDTIYEKAEASARKKLEGEFNQKVQEEVERRMALPPTSSDLRGKTAGRGKPIEVDQSLDEIIGS